MSGYLVRGQTLWELAGRTGMSPELERAVAGYNAVAERGGDPAFLRSSTAYNLHLGDPSRTPDPCVAPIEHGPYYAVRVVPGDLGTFAGLVTDVLDADRRPIAGLYAVRNDTASIMGGNYPGGGITLRPAMTFGYIAGCHLADAGGSHPCRTA